MTTYDTSVKFPKLNFDDFVQYQNRKVQLTHYDTDHKTPIFLQFVDDEAKPVYCVGFSNAIEWLKTGILKNPEVKVKTTKAKLNGKPLIVKTWKAANDGTVFSINYDGQDLDTWEFERIIFPDLSSLSRSHLNLFSPWFTNVFAPARYAPDFEDAEKHKFPSTFKVDDWNVALHIVERVEIVLKVLKNESIET